ncbi:TPM domain-containing protein [Sphingomonas sp. G-3-2-10]|uniref:TPM domain-containing protein n=1 Tax=Sphingomonas sp. G-3-2-10 TaxID=2728838 RepID=UPI00146AB2CC|nr:TPM domain-containing protein [Sphingomonas sp. G-3-2-10]NML07718.1 TPM domain-containing protein [Sphingomonas sp. G-3-2-10]
MKALRLLLALLLLLALPASAFAQTFPKLTGRVVDAANLLDPAQEAELTKLSEDIQKASTRQFVVATIPDLQGYPIEDYGYRLGRAWKIGQSEANNGIILIVAPKERLVRIEVGYGLEPIMTDGFSGLIIDREIRPRFRAGDMGGGIMAGAAAIAEQMKLPLEAGEARAKAKLDAERKTTVQQGDTRPRRTDDGFDLGSLGFLFVIVVMAIIFAAMRGASRRGRRYRGDGTGVAGEIGNILLWTAVDAALRSGGRRSGGGWSGGSGWGGGSSGGGGSSWSGGGGGFSGGSGSFGGGGATGSW